jgi:hypothetical protein
MGVQPKSGGKFDAIGSSRRMFEERQMIDSDNEAMMDVNALFRRDEFEALQ